MFSDGSGNYKAIDTPNIYDFNNGVITQNQFDNLPTGMYAAYSGYFPATRLGILPTNIKGCLTCMSYQNGPSVYNKLYTWTSVSNQTYYARINEGNWNTWTTTIQNVGDPTNAQDVATKNYVDLKTPNLTVDMTSNNTTNWIRAYNISGTEGGHINLIIKEKILLVMVHLPVILLLNDNIMEIINT